MIDFTMTFLHVFAKGVYLCLPILLFMLVMIFSLAVWSGRRMHLKWGDLLYWAFITALTVGYGDITPRDRVAKTCAILIGLFGILFTGILVAIAVSATTIAIQQHVDLSAIKPLP
ncbi:potassium channel family protein [Desulfobulbus alkaliphilus]|uniref:potassium channel family protein n=1 Tax=Desulfobulbus alkaliphilus TaxID=869814 RepID=UPI0019638387|nr:potassium channel family protein [Desulfobulbus alkaliphilus]MBM9536226.1 two pore domain potassium channel family protein [Desulfobulbus alkaliphilus]